MWEQISTAVIYGAIGGGGGALIGGLLALPFRSSKIGPLMATVLTVAGAVVGYNVAKPLLEPYIGQYLPAPSEAKVDAQIDLELDALFEQLEAVPTFAAIMKRDPEFRTALERDFRRIVKEANSPAAATQMAFATMFNEVQGRIIYYMKRSRDEDLVDYYRQTNEILAFLSTSDPQFCYNSSYNPAALIGLELSAIRDKYGAERYDRHQLAGARTIENAYDDVPDYNVTEAQAALGRATEILLATLGQENLGMITGERSPSSAEDYKLVCDATVAVNNSLLNEENAAQAIRHVFVLSGGG